MAGTKGIVIGGLIVVGGVVMLNADALSAALNSKVTEKQKNGIIRLYCSNLNNSGVGTTNKQAASPFAGALSSAGNAKSEVFGPVQDSTKKVEIAIPQDYAHMEPLVESWINEVNLLLPGSAKTLKVKFVHPLHNDPDSCEIFYERYPSPHIFGKTGLFNDTARARLSLFHEQAHPFYFFCVSDSAKQELALLFAQALNHSFTISGRSGSVTIFDISQEDADRFHPIFSLFDESSYHKIKDWTYGHPSGTESERKKLDPKELAASAPVVLRFFTDEFLSRLEALAASDKKAAYIACKIATCILGMWDGTGFFSPGIAVKINGILQNCSD